MRRSLQIVDHCLVRRKVFALDDMIAKLQADCSRVSSYLGERQRRADGWKAMTIGAIASYGITFLTVFTIAEVVFKATQWFHHVDEKGSVHGNAELIAVFIGLACALVAAGLQLKGLKADHSHNRLHAFGEIVKHAELK